MKSPLSAIIAIGAGLVVLLGYFIPTPGLSHVRDLLLSWAVLVAAVAVWIGVINLLSVHWKKVRDQHPNGPYSMALIAAFLLTLIVGTAEGFLNPGGADMQWAVNSIQVPVEASLLSILAVTLVYAAVRLLRQRRDTLAILFLGSSVIFLIVGSGIFNSLNIPGLSQLAELINQLPVAGMRGILLGVALGSLATGLRILMGADRPYRG